MKSKKFLAWLLTLAMLTTLIPSFTLTTFAAEDAHTHPICCDNDCTDHTSQEWTAWNESGSLPTASGYYYLTTNVKLTAEWYPAADTYLCLNGKVIEGNGSETVIRVFINTSFTLTDCDNQTTHKFSVDEDTGLWTLDEENGTKSVTGGVITGGKSTNQNGGGVRVDNGTFEMYGGTIVGNTATNGCGGGVYVGTNNTFNMCGGVICGNVVSNDYGGGVSVDGRFTMTDGAISANTATNGGGVIAKASSTFTMTGGEISGNTANYFGGGVFLNGTFIMTGGEISGNAASIYGGGVNLEYGTFNLSGTPVIKENTVDNICIWEGLSITVNGALTDGANIGVTMLETTGTFAQPDGTNITSLAAYKDYFSSDASDYEVSVNGNNLDLVDAEAPTYTVAIADTTNGTVTADKTTAAAGVEITLTISPATDYELDTLIVKDADDNEVTVTDNKFTMPAKNVTVTATFKAVEYAASVTTSEGVTTNYKEFNDAFAAAAGAPGSTITLMTDIDTTSDLTIASGNFTIDLNGYTWTMGAGLHFYIKGTSNIRIIDGSDDEKGMLILSIFGIELHDSAKLELAGCMLTSAGSIINMSCFGSVTSSELIVSDATLNTNTGNFAITAYGASVTITGNNVIDGLIAYQTGRFDLCDFTNINGFQIGINSTATPPTIGMDIVLPDGYCFYLGGSVVTELEANKTYTVGVETRTITFDANGGTVTPASAETGTDGKLTELPTPLRSGYTFNGWFDAQTGGTEVTTDKEYTENTTIYAQWTKKSSSSGGGVTRYTVKFETNGGTTVSNKTVTRNSKLTEPTEPTRDGYTFDGWYTDKELTKAYDFDTKVTKAITLYAKWTENEVDNTDDKTDDKTDTPDTPVWENPFTDVKADDWYYENVEYAVENGLFNGTTETTFAPNGIITRAMMVTVLYRAEGEPTVSGITSFADLEKGQYYLDAVCWSQLNGIVKGVSENLFAPDQNITREQIAAIMHRYAKYKGYDVSVGENTNILSYDDFDSISEYAIASMQYACGSGLMKGKTISTLNPLDNATRAEIAAILHRFIEGNK